MTKKRKIQADLKTAESSAIAVNKTNELDESPHVNQNGGFDNGASTSKQVFDPRKSYAYSIKDEPRKLKYLRKRTLLESANSDHQSGFVTNCYASINDNPSFHTMSTKYPTAKTLIGYAYNGEKEVDRLDRIFGYSKRGEHETEEQVHNHKQVHEDLVEAQRLFDDLSRDNARLGSLGVIADKIGWRQMPSSLVARLHEDSVKQAFETDQMTNSEIQSLIRHDCLDWLDNYDIANPPGKSILKDLENPHFGGVDPPISCCIFTKHRNGQISRCLREPIKAFSLQLSAKVSKKCLPYSWNKNVKIPAICTFHHSIIEKEPKHTEFNPFFERALGKHEKIEAVKFTEKPQFDQLGKFIDRTLQAEKQEYTDAMSFDLRLLKLLEPPKTNQAMQEVKNRQLFDTEIVRNGKSVEDFDECYDKAIRRCNELRSSSSKCPYKNEMSDEETEEFELPSSVDEWLPKKVDEPGPSLPICNSLINTDKDLNDDERILYKASEFGLLDLNESPLVEAAERYRSLLDINAYDDDTLRVFGSKSTGIEAPRLNFEAISAASIRRIKKFYNLPNRSGATSKPLLLEGLSDYFTNKPVNELEIAQEFFTNMNNRQRSKEDTKGSLYDNKTVTRKQRQTKKTQINSDLKYLNERVVAETSATSSSNMLLSNLTVINPTY